MRTAERFHDFSAGHRVVGHENLCRQIHGHNYRVTFICSGELDSLGRVIDFGEIKKRLCMWLEEKWDHRCLLWDEDPLLLPLIAIEPSIVPVNFNPTAENIAEHLVTTVGPKQLEGTGITLISCRVQETYKCSATFSL